MGGERGRGRGGGKTIGKKGERGNTGIGQLHYKLQDHKLSIGETSTTTEGREGSEGKISTV